jgi:site-specific recombinase XerD
MKPLPTQVPQHLLPERFITQSSQYWMLPLAPATTRTYNHHLKAYSKFCREMGYHLEYPHSDYSIMAYLVSLASQNKQYATIQAYLSAITFAHKVRSLRDPGSSYILKRFMAGLKKTVAQGFPLQPINHRMLSELLQLLDGLPRRAVPDYTRLLIKTVMSTLYFGCLRVSEVAISGLANHAIHWDKVTFQTSPPRAYPSSVTFTLLSFKHSKQPQSIRIQATNQPTCPVRLLWDYHTMRPKSPYLFCDDRGNPISRKLVHRSSFSSKRVNTHSFRIGWTTDLVLKGASDACVRHVGGWSSNAHLKYIRSMVVM